MEDIDVATAATTTTTKKRARATGDKPKRERKPKGLTGPGITIINNRFVCAYTGELITHAFVPDAVKEVAFANLPCAVAWVKASAAKDEEKATIISNMCTQAGQVLESVPELPEREALIGFGGERVFDEWFPDIQLWNAVTRKTGVDVATFTAARGVKGAKSKKVKPAAHGMARGAHLIAAGGVFPRNIKAIDAPAHKAPVPGAQDAEETAAKHVLASAAVVTAVQQLRKYAEEHKLDVQVHATAKGTLLACLTPLPLDGELPEDSELTVNAIASELAGCTVYGPALYFASSKTTVKPAQ